MPLAGRLGSTAQYPDPGEARKYAFGESACGKLRDLAEIT
jgi:hypothetical protein